MPKRRLDEVRETRLRDPGAIVEAAKRRYRRPLVPDDGRLFIIAADHAARGTLGVAGRPLAMADRDDLLARLCTALSRPGVDGVLATADVIEDLLLLGALDDRVAIGSMNRGGLAGAVFEMDDRFTGYDVETIVQMGLDGGKMLCRVALDDPATPRTLERCAQAVDGLAANCLMALIEPFWTVHGASGEAARNDLSTEAVVRSVAVTSALGATSAYTWLKVPVTAEMERVAAATTLPMLVLGGDAGSDHDGTLDALERVLAVPGVRGLAAGRALLYPDDDDVVSAVDRMAAALGRMFAPSAG